MHPRRARGVAAYSTAIRLGLMTDSYRSRSSPRARNSRCSPGGGQKVRTSGAVSGRRKDHDADQPPWVSCAIGSLCRLDGTRRSTARSLEDLRRRHCVAVFVTNNRIVVVTEEGQRWAYAAITPSGRSSGSTRCSVKSGKKPAPRLRTADSTGSTRAFVCKAGGRAGAGPVKVATEVRPAPWQVASRVVV